MEKPLIIIAVAGGSVSVKSIPAIDLYKKYPNPVALV